MDWDRDRDRDWDWIGLDRIGLRLLLLPNSKSLKFLDACSKLGKVDSSSEGFPKSSNIHLGLNLLSKVAEGREDEDTHGQEQHQKT